MKKSFENTSNIFSLSVFCLLTGMSTMSFSMPDKTASLAFETVDDCPTASFSAANNGCIVSEEVIFVNQSLDATSYHWDFGDGNSSTEGNPRHAYQVAGAYTVTLTAFIDGCHISYIGTVDVVMS